MPTYVLTDKCDSCEGLGIPVCMHICPHDLMRLDIDGSETGHAMKSYNQEPEQCWECYACVKACPENAIENRSYADVTPLGGMVQPVRGSDSIVWNIKFRNGNKKRFEFPIRTIAEDAIDPYSGTPQVVEDELTDHSTLFTKGTHSCDFSQFNAS